MLLMQHLTGMESDSLSEMADRELQNLIDVYNERSDQELLGLYENRDDLTDLAQGALAQVLKDRKISVTGVPVEEPVVMLSPEDSSSEQGVTLEDDEAALTGLGNDPFSIREAIRLLEAAEIPHRAAKFGEYHEGDGMRSRTVQQLGLIVKRDDEARANALLQSKMNLFPDERFAAKGTKEETMMLGEFKRAKALRVAQALGEAGISYVWSDGRDDTTLEEDEARIEVFPSHAEEADALVEKIPD